MKILITGSRGQLGFDLLRVGANRSLALCGVDRDTLDITKAQAVQKFVNEQQPDAIIHCAAYTAVDHAEVDRKTCWEVNVDGTKYLAQAARSVGAKFMYISTDYVFDGEGVTPFLETASPNPIGYYGMTKHEGEKVVQSTLADWFIVRISWVFGINGHNFVKTMLNLATTRDSVNVVADQIGSPTYTFDLANLLLEMIQTDKFGIYHATNAGFVSWQGFATEVFQQAGKRITVNGISTAEYETKAPRPKNSQMSKQKLIDAGFTPLPAWQDAVSRYLKELSNEVQ